MTDTYINPKKKERNFLLKNVCKTVLTPFHFIFVSFQGTHWFYEIISMLLKGRADYAELTVEATFIDLTPIEQCDSVPSPRIIVSHMPYKYLPLKGMRRVNRIVHVSRNPKDVAVSLYCHLKSSNEFSTEDIEGVPGDWDTFVSKIIDGSFSKFTTG